MTKIAGKCHCGSISFDLETSYKLASFPMRRCTCSFCTKHAPIWTTDPGGEVTIKIENAKNLNKYRFGTSTADFLICKCCGNVVAAVDKTDAGPKAVINTNLFDSPIDVTNQIDVVDWDYETTEERRSRRAKNWTPAKLNILNI